MIAGPNDQPSWSFKAASLAACVATHSIIDPESRIERTVGGAVDQPRFELHAWPAVRSFRGDQMSQNKLSSRERIAKIVELRASAKSMNRSAKFAPDLERVTMLKAALAQAAAAVRLRWVRKQSSNVDLCASIGSIDALDLIERDQMREAYASSSCELLSQAIELMLSHTDRYENPEVEKPQSSVPYDDVLTRALQAGLEAYHREVG